MTEAECRRKIITTYAGWTTLSALRRAPIKSRTAVYLLLGKVNFSAVLTAGGRAISTEDFAEWHRGAVEDIQKALPELVVGWAAKLVNVYLKTAAYLGDLGCKGLRELQHPPIDGGLWDGIKRWVGRVELSRPEKRVLLSKTHAVRRIKSITDYTTYTTIIEGCRDVAKKLRCRLIEVEQLWEGASAP